MGKIFQIDSIFSYRPSSSNLIGQHLKSTKRLGRSPGLQPEISLNPNFWGEWGRPFIWAFQRLLFAFSLSNGTITTWSASQRVWSSVSCHADFLPHTSCTTFQARLTRPSRQVQALQGIDQKTFFMVVQQVAYHLFAKKEHHPLLLQTHDHQDLLSKLYQAGLNNSEASSGVSPDIVETWHDQVISQILGNASHFSANKSSEISV